MPAAETIERFIARVEQNAHVEAVEEFYTEDASMQENQSAPRVGRDAHMENERRVLAKARSLTSKCVRPVFVNGDRGGYPLDISIRVAGWHRNPHGGTRLPALVRRTHRRGNFFL
jgi:hypothetical protein